MGRRIEHQTLHRLPRHLHKEVSNSKVPTTEQQTVSNRHVSIYVRAAATKWTGGVGDGVL